MTVYQPEVGRYFEDFAVGDVYKHWPGRTIAEADNVWFTLLTMNTHPLHFDNVYASGQAFGRPLVNSTLVLAIVVGLSVKDTSQNAVANLGWTDIRLPAPVFVGDTIYAESKVLNQRLSKSRPEAGIIQIQTTGYNQDNTVIMVFERSFMVKRKGYDAGRLPRFGTDA